jgi:hypothetical protein
VHCTVWWKNKERDTPLTLAAKAKQKISFVIP